MLALLALAHVPTYDSSLCSTPPRHHTTSQVGYATVGPSSTAGIEIHCSSTSCPFEDNELIDYDFTMRESYSLDTFSVYVGCLGCEENDPITIPPLQFELEGPVLEPFAQGRYYSMKGPSKKFNASLIRDTSVCPHEHWGLRIVTYANATTMRLGFVVGLKESFTPEVCAPASLHPAPRQPNPTRACTQELLRYPEFIITNHRDWNDLAWSLPVVAVAVILLDVLLVFTLRSRWVPSILDDYRSPRSWLLQVASWAFAITAVEVALHLIIFQVGAKLDYALPLGLVLVSGFSNAFPWFLTTLIWRSHLHRGAGCYYSSWWFLLELGVAVGFLFTLGSGLWVGPIALGLDALMRASELLPEGVEEREEARRMAVSDRLVELVGFQDI